MELRCEDVVVRLEKASRSSASWFGGPGRRAEEDAPDQFTLGPVTLAIRPGLITGLVGRNGSGKTTLLRTLAGRIKPLSGRIIKGDSSFVTYQDSAEARNGKISLVGGAMEAWLCNKPAALAEAMMAFEPDFDQDYFRKHMAEFRINAEDPPRYYSDSEKKLYLLLFELARKPDILLVDEPTSGLGPGPRRLVLDLLQEYMVDEEHSLVFSTHITDDLDRIADRIALLDEGKLILDEEKGALKKSMSENEDVLPTIAEIMAAVTA